MLDIVTGIIGRVAILTLILIAGSISLTHAQSETTLPLPTTYQYPGGVLRLSGCRNNLDIAMRRCAGLPAHSEIQTYAQVTCRGSAWRAYFETCTLTRPVVGECKNKTVQRGEHVVCE